VLMGWQILSLPIMPKSFNGLANSDLPKRTKSLNGLANSDLPKRTKFFKNSIPYGICRIGIRQPIIQRSEIDNGLANSFSAKKDEALKKKYALRHLPNRNSATYFLNGIRQPSYHCRIGVRQSIRNMRGCLRVFIP